MRPDERDLDEEIRGHLAINIKERIDRGEDPVSARRAALMEFGYVPAVRDEMRRVWYSRWYDRLKRSHEISGSPCAPSPAPRH